MIRTERQGLPNGVTGHICQDFSEVERLQPGDTRCEHPGRLKPVPAAQNDSTSQAEQSGQQEPDLSPNARGGRLSNESGQQSIGMVVERMFQRYHLVLMKYLRDRLYNKQEAEDVAQEVYYRIARRSVSDQIDFPKAFLMRTARNLLIDMNRASPKCQALLSIDDDEDLEMIATLDDDTDQKNPESEISAEQLLTGMKTALAELNPKCQAVFVMNRIDGISYRQIAKDLNMSESMVGKYMRKALKHLMQSVEVEL